MKIFFPIGAFFPCQIGGQASAVYWHVNALANEGVNCDVITTMYGIDPGTVASDSINKTTYGTVYYAKSILHIKNMMLIYQQIKKADVIHLSGMFNLPSTLTLIIWAVFFPAKLIICSVHGEMSPEALRFSRLKKQPTLLLYRMLFNKILFHSTSDKETQHVKSFFKGSKTLQIPNLMHPAEPLKISKKKQLLFMGRIHEIKALHKFIEALSLSKLFKNSDFIFDITGTHEDRHDAYFQMIKKMVLDFDLSEKVKFSGHLTGAEKENKYAESYFLVLPSESENFGNVVVEALNQKTPVLASLGTPWRVLEDYGCGFHTGNTPQNLADYIDRIIMMDKREHDAYCQNAQVLVNEKFNIKTQISVWIDTYRKMSAFKL